MAISLFSGHWNAFGVLGILLFLGVDVYLVLRFWPQDKAKLLQRRLQKADEMLALARSYNEQVEVLFKATMVAHTAIPANRKRTLKRLEAEIRAMESTHIAFARAIIANQRYFDPELAQILQEYRTAVESSASLTGDLAVIARRMIPRRMAIANATGKLETKVKRLRLQEVNRGVRAVRL